MNTLRILVAGLFMLAAHETPAFSQDIFATVMSGDLNRTRLLIEEQPGLIDTTSWGNWTPLHRASQHGHKDIVDFLLQEGANLEARTVLGMTPLYVAIYSQKRDIVQFLIEKGADIRAVRSDGETMLHIAAAIGNEGIVDELISNGLDVNVNKRYGITPLHLASIFGHKATVQTLVSHGADTNARNDNGSTSFNLAMAAGERPVAEFLLAAGADSALGQYVELSGDYLGQATPGSKPEPFAPGILLNTHRPHGGLSISPDGNSIYWASGLTYGTYQKIWTMSREGNRWSRPEVAPFCTEYIDGRPSISSDGRVYFLQSNRPTGGHNDPADFNIWRLERSSAGWGELKNLGSPPNSDKNDLAPWVSDNGTLYFQSDIEGGYGAPDIYLSRFVDGQYQEPENLGDSINSSSMETIPYVAGDESYLLFASLRQDGYGDFDLYISFRMEDGSWTKARNLGDLINTPARECSPTVTNDGQFMFFESRRNGIGELFWVDAKIIEEMRRLELRQ